MAPTITDSTARDDPLRVGILVKDFPPHSLGGLELQTRRIAQELHEREDCAVTVYTKSYNRTNPYDHEFPVVAIPHLETTPGKGLSFKTRALVRLVRDADEIDILQCMQVNPYGFIGYLYNRLTGTPYFAWMREGYQQKTFTGLDRAKAKRVFSDTINLTQTAKTRADVLKDFPGAELRVIGNGVSVPDRSAQGDAIVYVGRLSESKCVDDLIRAVEGLDERLLVVGDGPSRDHLESLAADLDVAATFTGRVPPDEVPAQLSKGKLLVLPSKHSEGMPNAVLEAMAVGLPVIASDIGGTREIIREGETGFIFEPGHVTELRRTIRQYADDEQLLADLGQNAREYIRENHSWERVITELVAFYEEVLNEHRTE